MKKRALSLAAIILLLVLFGALLVSCGENAYTVKFYVDGELFKAYKVERGGMLDVIPDVPQKEGMTGVWDHTDFDEINSNMVVLAVYTKNQYTISFYVDGELYEQRNVQSGRTLTDLPEVPARDGFDGVWNVTDFGPVDRDLSVFAVYTPSVAELVFYADGEPAAYRYVSNGENLIDIPEPPLPAGKNYSAKWVSDENDFDSDADFTGIVGNMEFYAYYYLTIDLVGGEADSEYICEIDGEAENLSAGERPGMDFIGWYFDENYAEMCVFPHKFTENIFLYARWIENDGDEGFAFENGLATGYEGGEEVPVMPYSYMDNGVKTVVTGIAPNAFRNSEIRGVVLPSTVVTIGDSAFENCENLERITFRDGSFVEELGEAAFRNCGALLEFEFSAFTVSIGAGAFENCGSVTNYINLGLTKIDSVPARTFGGNVAAELFELPETLKNIGNEAFSGDSRAAFSFVRNNVENLGDMAFFGCEALDYFSAPALKTVGAGAYAGCRNLVYATMTADSLLPTLFGTEPGRGFYAVETADGTNYLPNGLTSVSVTAGSDGILLENAFADCYMVKNVRLLGVNTISEHAFYVQKGLFPTDFIAEFNITMSDSLVEIGARAFEGRVDIHSISLPSSLRKIGERAFADITELRTVTTQGNSSLEEIGAFAFENTRFVAESASGIKIVARIAVGISKDYFNGRTEGGVVELGATDFNGVVKIAPYAFANINFIGRVNLPDSVVEIGSHAFSGNSRLRTFRLGINAKVGEGILSGCDNIEELSVGYSFDPATLFGTEEIAEGAYPVTREGATYYVTDGFRKLNVLNDNSTAITEGLFVGFDSLESIEIADGVRIVYDMAFADNPNLKSIVFPQTLTDLGYSLDEEVYVGVFSDSTQLEQVTLREGLTTIYPNAFKNTHIGRILIPSTVTRIGEGAFEGSDVSEVGFFGGSEELEIEDRAFADGERLVSVTLPSRARIVGKEAFSSQINLNSVTLNDGLEYIGERAFENCAILSLEIPLSVVLYGSDETESETCLSSGLIAGNVNFTTLILHSPVIIGDLFGESIPTTLRNAEVKEGIIRDGQFMGARNLANISLGEVTEIGAEAFAGCVSLGEITFPNSLVSIGDMAFHGCTSLRNAVCLENSGLREIGEAIFMDCTALSYVRLSDELATEELKGTFNGCVNLYNANIPAGVKVIGDDAFNGCPALRSIDIPDEVERIGDNAFKGCSSLEFEDIRFTELTAIGANAFAGCALFTGFKAETIMEIGEGAFNDCVALREITVIDKSVGEYISDCSKIVTVNVSACAKTVAENLLSGCDSVTTVMLFTAAEDIENILKGLKDLDDKTTVFVTDSAYEAVSEETKTSFGAKLNPNPSTLDDAVYSFDDENMTAKLVSAKFSGERLCLPSYVMHNDEEYALTVIGKSAFAEPNFREIRIPYSVITIEDFAFRCTTSASGSLESVVFEIGSLLTDIGKYAFYGNAKLTSISLPDRLENIGEQAFGKCENLSEVTTTYYSRLKNIGSYAFAETYSLKEMTFNGGIAKICANAFYNSGLTKLTFGEKARGVTVEDGAFVGCHGLNEEEVKATLGAIGAKFGDPFNVKAEEKA